MGENVSLHTSCQSHGLYINFISVTVVVVDEVLCFGPFPLPPPQQMYIDELTDNDPGSCIELDSIATELVHVYVPINRRPINYVRVQGFRLLCSAVAGMSVFRTDICQTDLCNIEQCVALVALDDNQPASCSYRCYSSSKQTEYIIVSINFHNNESPSICEIHRYWSGIYSPFKYVDSTPGWRAVYISREENSSQSAGIWFSVRHIF